MKRTFYLNWMVLILELSFTVVGCKRKGDVTPIPGQPFGVRQPGDAEALPPIAGPTDPNAVEGAFPMADDPDRFLNRVQDREFFAANTVYFDLDSSVVKPGEIYKLETIANYLNQQENQRYDLLIEGHCDERGTEGYNLALGERRALSARESLVGLGVSPDRMNTVSHGESRPAVEGNGESAWSMNRRSEFVLLKEKL
jgi:peptidoglycan-associated lipoprotein